jgi:uncharacterized cupin superfamily protein
MNISVEKKVSQNRLDELGVSGWPIWEKEVSKFPWFYDSKEVCYILEGEVEVMEDDGSSVQFGAGDLVTFSQGLSCTWNIKKPVRKHYRFG